jgi:flotillin
MLPDLVTAAAQGLAAANLTVLNGTDGVSQVVTGLVGQGMSILDTLRASAAARPAVTAAPADGDEPASPPESARRKRGA